MKYFLVTAKCGHVGRGKYIEIEFPIFAESKSAAAQMCLKRPKVKKHLKNAITSVCEIDEDSFKRKLIDFRNNTYIRAHTKKEITEWFDYAQELNLGHRTKRSFSNRKERIDYLKKKNTLKEEYLYV